jgi:hypothetical protein
MSILMQCFKTYSLCVWGLKNLITAIFTEPCQVLGRIHINGLWLDLCQKVLDFGGVCVTHLFSFLCCALFVFVLCAQYWVSLDCSFLITPSVYSKVYWRYQFPRSCKSEDRQCNDQWKKDKDEQWSTTENRKNGEIVTVTNREHIRGNLWHGYSPTWNQGLMATVNISTFTLNQENHLIQ